LLDGFLIKNPNCENLATVTDILTITLFSVISEEEEIIFEFRRKFRKLKLVEKLLF